MAGQNFIAKLLCSLGGDRYTGQGTEDALQESLDEAQKNTVRFDIRKDKWVLFSDHHRGAKNRADDFRLCEGNYVRALDHYFETGSSLCVMGDAEELWEEFPGDIIRNNSASFAAEKRFHDEGRYLRLWGNHDDIWSDWNTVRTILQPLYGKRHLNIPESILLEVRDGNEILGRILLIHGHQGTQNQGKSTKFAKWILHNIWRRLQVLTGFSCNTPATDWKIRDDRDKIIYHWTARQTRLVLIAGHTHAPVFESYTHRARLMMQISTAIANVDRLAENERDEELHRIDTLSSDLKTLEGKLSAEEREQVEPLENPLPCYFNTGCCSLPDGDITGIEIADGEMRLVRWPDDDGSPRQKVLQAGSVREIFQALKQ